MDIRKFAEEMFEFMTDLDMVEPPDDARHIYIRNVEEALLNGERDEIVDILKEEIKYCGNDLPDRVDWARRLLKEVMNI